MATRKQKWRINGKPKSYVLEKAYMLKDKKTGKEKEVWSAEAWYTDPFQMVRSLRDMKARSYLNLGDDNLLDAIRKANNDLMDMLKDPAPLKEFAIE